MHVCISDVTEVLNIVLWPVSQHFVQSPLKIKSWVLSPGASLISHCAIAWQSRVLWVRGSLCGFGGKLCQCISVRAQMSMRMSTTIAGMRLAALFEGAHFQRMRRTHAQNGEADQVHNHNRGDAHPLSLPPSLFLFSLSKMHLFVCICMYVHIYIYIHTYA
jgi:hypothetical protein